ncbi:MAG: methylated-DNA--[protein]-cysteine S-methyltransferase [Verrucomicrobiota bacterium]|jgi:AraC family transcriptional regulator of adaptative response/methylated-DNA-[protein]-cysteine methyltransferase
MNDYERIARVIRYLDESHADQPNLTTLARRVGLSQHHFHRLFTSWAGITPKDFLQCLTLTHAREMLRQGKSVLDATMDTGLSSPGRLHDLCVSLEAASPGEVKSGGEGWTITIGFADSPFGKCLVGESRRGICHLSFVESSDKVALDTLKAQWPRARLQQDNAAASQLVNCIFHRKTVGNSSVPLRAFVRGTPFQVRVWRALLQVQRGTLVSYGGLAAAVNQPAAARAVGSAVGQNSLAYLIPCHRVIRETGVIGDYRWGQVRKRAILAWENAPRVAAKSKHYD